MTLAATKLYTPEVLALATQLAAYPLNSDLPLLGNARSATCGSTITLGLAPDDAGRIARLGIAAHACAIGQAAAAIFAEAAMGKNAAEIAFARVALQEWLSGAGPLPDWPGLNAIAAVPSYPARHGAVMLTWNAAASLLGESACAR